MPLIQVQKGATLIVSESAYRDRENDIVVGKKATLIVVPDSTTREDRIRRGDAEGKTSG